MNDIELNKEYICYISKSPIYFCLRKENLNWSISCGKTIYNCIIKTYFLNKNGVVLMTYNDGNVDYIYPLTFDTIINVDFLNYIWIYLLNNE